MSSSTDSQGFDDYEGEVSFVSNKKRFWLDFRPNLSKEYWKGLEQENTEPVERYVIEPEEPYIEIEEALVPGNVCVLAKSHYLPLGGDRGWKGTKSLKKFDAQLALIFRLSLGAHLKNPVIKKTAQAIFIQDAEAALSEARANKRDEEDPAGGETSTVEANVTVVEDEVRVAIEPPFDRSTLQANVTVVPGTDGEDEETSTPERPDGQAGAERDIVLGTDLDEGGSHFSGGGGKQEKGLAGVPDGNVCDEERHAVCGKKRKRGVPRQRSVRQRGEGSSQDGGEGSDDPVREGDDDALEGGGSRPSEGGGGLSEGGVTRPPEVDNGDEKDVGPAVDRKLNGEQSGPPAKRTKMFHEYRLSDTVWADCKAAIDALRGKQSNKPDYKVLRDRVQLLAFLADTGCRFADMGEFIAQVETQDRQSIRLLQRTYRNWRSVGDVLVKHKVNEKPWCKTLTQKDVRRFLTGYEPGEDIAATEKMIHEVCAVWLDTYRSST